VLLGFFLVAFFLRHVRGTAVFWGAIAAQAATIAIFLARRAQPDFPVSYLGTMSSAAWRASCSPC